MIASRHILKELTKLESIRASAAVVSEKEAKRLERIVTA